MGDNAQRGRRWTPGLLGAGAAVLAVAALAIGAAGGSGDAGATPALTFRDAHVTLAAHNGGATEHVRVHLLILDDGSRPFEDVAAEVRAAVVSEFPGAVAIDAEGSVSAAYVAAPYSWPGAQASWAYNPSGGPGLENEQAVVASAAASWNGAGGSPWMFFGGGISSAGTGACRGDKDGLNTVGWRPLSSPGVLGRTCTWYGEHGGNAATEFDIELDPEWDWTMGTPVGVDLFTVAAHEFGHALGLDHTQESNCPAALMCSRYRAGTALDGPQADDIAGLVAIYGGNGPEPTATPSPTPTPTPTPTHPGLLVDDTPAPPPAADETPPGAHGDAPPPPNEPQSGPVAQRVIIPLMARD